jgi:hypothetical protein
VIRRQREYTGPDEYTLRQQRLVTELTDDEFASFSEGLASAGVGSSP